MNDAPIYDVAIVGGGLAGLSLSIQMVKQGHSVILFEKESYPFHKVCGEYISLESWDFVQSLGVPLSNLHLPVIDSLTLTSPSGKVFSTKLPLGGFGISRFLLDQSLFEIAQKSGVVVKQTCRVDDVQFDNDIFEIHTASEVIKAKVCCAAFGKRSNIDVKWKRDFLQRQDKRLDNFVAVKYHVNTEWKQNVIGLHNFENGYCGISKVEGDRYCLCYMTRAENLKRSGNNIQAMEKDTLHQNPHLKTLFSESKILPEFPVVISQINFHSKSTVENGVLMLGDASGMITPLCGNGMSIAFHTSKIAAGLIDAFLKRIITRGQMENNYSTRWKNEFSSRLKTGRMLQKFFGRKSLSNVFVSSFSALPFLAKPLIRMTHGKPF